MCHHSPVSSGLPLCSDLQASFVKIQTTYQYTLLPLSKVQRSKQKDCYYWRWWVNPRKRLFPYTKQLMDWDWLRQACTNSSQTKSRPREGKQAPSSTSKQEAHCSWKSGVILGISALGQAQQLVNRGGVHDDCARVLFKKMGDGENTPKCIVWKME